MLISSLTDEDECAIANGGCEGVCTNTNGSFECGCNHGFQLGIDGKSCDGKCKHTDIVYR